MTFTERHGIITFYVRVQPRASRDSIEGEWKGAGPDGAVEPALKVRLTAPPVDDCANEALRRLLAARLNLPLTAVRILGGERSRTKRVEVRGASSEIVRALFASKAHA